MGNYQADQTVVEIVRRKQAPPLIKLKEFTGTLVELSKKISSVQKSENEAREFVMKTRNG